MKTILKITSIVLLLTFIACKENVKTEKKTESIDLSSEIKTVEKVMKSYKDAIQNLTTNGTLKLFTKEATVFESGGSEGTYANYLICLSVSFPYFLYIYTNY